MSLFILAVVCVVAYVLYKNARAGKQGQSGRGSVEDRIGAEGELMVQSELYRIANKGYVIFNDILLGTPTSYTQIDHLIISIYGIFVLETKNYGGKVYGHLNAKQWKHVTKRGSNTFYNPIKQNESHVYAVKKALGINNDMYYQPLVVFTGRCELHIDPTDKVIELQHLIPVITRYQVPIMSMQEVQELAMRLNNSIVLGSAARDEHKRQVKEKQARGSAEMKVFGVCPNCGGRMELKHGKYGNFYGCENYPRCRFTAKL